MNRPRSYCRQETGRWKKMKAGTQGTNWCQNHWRNKVSMATAVVNQATTKQSLTGMKRRKITHLSVNKTGTPEHMQHTSIDLGDQTQHLHMFQTAQRLHQERCSLNPNHNHQARSGRNPTRTTEPFGGLGWPNSTLVHDANSATHPSMEVLLETWRMQQQQNTRQHNRQQARSGKNLGIQDQCGEQGRSSAFVHDPNSVETPSREAQFEACQMQNPRHNEQPRQLLVDPVLRCADNLAFQNDPVFYDHQHHQPPLTEVQGQNNRNIGEMDVDETNRAFAGAGRKAFFIQNCKANAGTTHQAMNPKYCEEPHFQKSQVHHKHRVLQESNEGYR